MIITDIDGDITCNCFTFVYEPVTREDVTQILKPSRPRYIGPSLGGNPYYYSLHRPRNKKETAAFHRTQNRN